MNLPFIIYLSFRNNWFFFFFGQKLVWLVININKKMELRKTPSTIIRWSYMLNQNNITNTLMELYAQSKQHHKYNLKFHPSISYLWHLLLLPSLVGAPLDLHLGEQRHISIVTRFVIFCRCHSQYVQNDSYLTQRC